MRTLGDGTGEVTVMNGWDSMESIQALAGAEPQAARYHPEDDRFLLAWAASGGAPTASGAC